MLKDSFLIHAIGSRDHPKLVEAERASRGLFKAVWWDLVDMLWEQGGYLPMDFDKLAYILRYPTPEEVRRVVMDFGLFENDGERIWNDSALDGIRHKREVSARNAENRRGKGAQGNRSTPVEGTNNDRSTPVEGPLPIEKEREKERKRDISLSASDAEKADIYRLFFFKNFQNPEKELQRFLDRYEGNWTRTGSTRPERDHMKLARTWKPEKADPRFSDPALLDWLGKLTAALEAEGGIDSDAFLHSIQSIAQEKKRGPHEGQVFIVVSSKEWQDRIFEGLDKIGPGFLPPYKSFTVKCSAQ